MAKYHINFATSMLALVLFLNFFHEGHGKKKDCYISVQNALSICPWPVIVKRNQKMKVDIKCISADENYQLMEIGVNRKGTYFSVAQRKYGKKVQYVIGLYSFKPASPSELIEDKTTITLILRINSAITLSDLDNTWACRVVTSISMGNDQRILEALPYPSNTTFTVQSAKDTYRSDDIVTLACSAFTALNFNNTTPKRYAFKFQHLDDKNWVSINEHDGLQVQNITRSSLKLDGIFCRQTGTIRLQASSIPGCSRRYRCVLAYLQTSFTDNMPQVTINRTLCEGGCGADLQICQIPPTLSPSETTRGSVSNTTALAPTNAPTKAYMTQGLLIAVGVPSGVMLICMVFLVLLYVQRRKMTQAAREMHTKRPTPSSHRMSTVAQNVVPDEFSQSSGFSNMESSSVLQSETSGFQPEASTYASMVSGVSEPSQSSTGHRQLPRVPNTPVYYF